MRGLDGNPIHRVEREALAHSVDDLVTLLVLVDELALVGGADVQVAALPLERSERGRSVSGANWVGVCEAAPRTPSSALSTWPSTNSRTVMFLRSIFIGGWI